MNEPIETVIVRRTKIWFTRNIKSYENRNKRRQDIKHVKNVYYRLTPIGILFPFSVTNDTKQIFFTFIDIDTIAITPDAKIIFTKAPFINYKQILLNKNFRQFLETILVSKKILRIGVQKTPYKKHTK